MNFWAAIGVYVLACVVVVGALSLNRHDGQGAAGDGHGHDDHGHGGHSH
ncbi:MAG: hypothetical protein ACM3XM_10880 [Mycobacterium leprae]